ncbi:MAG: DUF362 domain-containing protein [Promethearchaeia archaeon]
MFRIDFTMRGRNRRRSGRHRTRRPFHTSRVGVRRTAYPSSLTAQQTSIETGRFQRPTVDPPKCVGCGICAENCPAGAISIVDGKAQIEYSRCKNCGVCISICPQNAIS